MQNNKDIRKLIEASNMKYWQVAYKLGITDATFSKKLRFELSKEEKEKIKEIIKNNKED
jgi:predicted XRE-type DNA-binding protein